MSIPLPVKQTKYFTGKPCKRGHIADRYSASRACTECVREPANIRAKTWAQENPDKVRSSNLKKYNITLEQYNEMLINQNNSCAICGSPDPGVGSFAVDHDHSCCAERKTSCGKCIRGLLCSNCNNGLGRFKDNFEILLKAAKYLQKKKLQ